MHRPLLGTVILTSLICAAFWFVVALYLSNGTPPPLWQTFSTFDGIADLLALREVKLERAELLLLFLLAGVIPVLLFYRQFSRWLFAIQSGVKSFAEGELYYRLPEGGADEFSVLSELLNVMATNLRARIEAVTRQKNELDAVLSSMAEGLLAIDLDGHIISLNRAAEEVLGLEAHTVLGRLYKTVLPQGELLNVIEYALQNKEVTKDITLQGSSDQFINTLAAPLQDAAGGCIGAVVLLHDVTDLRKLEIVRRDFVANVSHELKTPITAIKGFVETLLQGAMDQPDAARRQLTIIERQADRLHAIIEDLLSLSRLEQQAENVQIEKKAARVFEILESAVEICAPKAEIKHMPIILQCPPEITANVNPSLLEQAVINLIDNAIKYSEPERPITVSGAIQDGKELIIAVKDQGFGIDAPHLPRVFERFYRVDRGRSRKMGGTGLGLAIVKHIAQVHGGSTLVDSKSGEGSTFTIKIPI